MPEVSAFCRPAPASGPPSTDTPPPSGRSARVAVAPRSPCPKTTSRARQRCPGHSVLVLHAWTAAAARQRVTVGSRQSSLMREGIVPPWSPAAGLLAPLWRPDRYGGIPEPPGPPSVSGADEARRTRSARDATRSCAPRALPVPPGWPARARGCAVKEGGSASAPVQDPRCEAARGASTTLTTRGSPEAVR